MAYLGVWGCHAGRAILKWKWVLQMQDTRSLDFLYWLGHLWEENGYRGGIILLSIIIIICGLMLAFWVK
ncbi:Imm17 family immunity protein [Butyricimonas virosa]|uniref:Uncharacterized protein n=1 Tax=Butyricimonas virosa TaxID=544645 RepID=A0A415QM67_9BACT|nr:hypothetical protein DWZ68_04700 [Butyricimonas virosa]HAM83823.1 hypothetical protein [Butyricimonas sp.]HCH87970.1 hypothetical protein [Butyricimonas sp.]